MQQPTASAHRLEPANAPARRNPQLDRILGYFNGEFKTDRFDGFGVSDDGSTDYFNPVLNPQNMRTRACVAVESVAFNEIVQDMPMIYVPCGISSGLRVHEALAHKNRNNVNTPGYSRCRSSYKADEQLGSAIHGQIIALNKADTLRRGAILARLHPQASIILPPIRESATRALQDHAFAGGQRYEEEDYMAFWYPAIDRCIGMCLDGDWNFSRNSIWEMMRGVLIQAGQVPSRPQADMDVFDLAGDPLSLQWRAEKLIETLCYQLGYGFDTREAATALAQIFTLDDDLRAGRIPVAGRAIHPVLAHRPPAELEAMDALRAHYQPVLLAHCAAGMRLDGLPPAYAQAAKKPPQALSSQQAEFFQTVASDISARANESLSVHTTPQLEKRLAQTPALAPRLYDSDASFFAKDSRALMFEDDLFGHLLHWERLALPFAIGATEIGLYPAAQPMATAIFTDLKRGAEGFARAQAAGVADMNELAGALGHDIQTVIAHNAEAAERLKAQLQAQSPGQTVVNTLSFLRISDAIAHFRRIGEGGNRSQRFVNVDGPAKPSPNLRLALQMKYLDRQVDRAVFQEGWEHSNDLVQLRVRARLIQAGLVPRPNALTPALRVFNESDLERPQTLLDDLRTLTAEVKRNAQEGVRAPEQALALVRLMSLHALLIDPSLQQTQHNAPRELVSTLRAEPSLASYPREEARQLCAEARALLTQQVLFLRSKNQDREADARLIPRERLELLPDASDDATHAAAKIVQNRLMREFITAQDVLIAKQEIAKQPRESGAVHLRRDGAQR